jgi:hypothetical protein
VSLQAQEQETLLRDKNRRVYELEQEKARLLDENRMHRMGGSKKSAEEGGVLSFRDNIEEERRRRKKEKAEKKKAEAEKNKPQVIIAP